MLRIGAFSEATGLSIKTLRYYDEIGILKPKEIDEYTGYRSYSEEQIEDAYLIIMLKQLEFSLEEILMYKDNLDYNIFENKKSQIMFNIQESQKKIVQIEELQRTKYKNNRPKVRTNYKIAC